MQLVTRVSTLVVLLLVNSAARADTIDEQFKKFNEKQIKIKDQTSDACDRANVVTITSTTDGKIDLRPGQTKYFKIARDKDEFCRSGGWYWSCGGSKEQSRIPKADYIKAVRKDNGVIEWYWVEKP
jgi:hypothetical protein